jgi:hypothetical protein
MNFRPGPGIYDTLLRTRLHVPCVDEKNLGALCVESVIKNMW